MNKRNKKLDLMNKLADELNARFKKEAWDHDMIVTLGVGLLQGAISTRLKWDHDDCRGTIAGALQQLIIDYEEAHRD